MQSIFSLFLLVIAGLLLSRASLVFAVYLQNRFISDLEESVKTKYSSDTFNFFSFNYFKNKDYLKFLSSDILSILIVSFLVLKFKESYFIVDGAFLYVDFIMLLSLLFVVLFAHNNDILEGYILDIYTIPTILFLLIITPFSAFHFNLLNYYSGFFLVIFIFTLLWILMRKQMGLGDIKYFLIVGIFFGFTDLIVVILISCILGILYGFYQFIDKKQSEAFYFGPFISYSIMITLLFNLTFPFL